MGVESRNRRTFNHRNFTTITNNQRRPATTAGLKPIEAKRMINHVIRDNYNLSDFSVTEDGAISLSEAAKHRDVIIITDEEDLGEDGDTTTFSNKIVIFGKDGENFHLGSRKLIFKGCLIGSNNCKVYFDNPNAAEFSIKIHSCFVDGCFFISSGSSNVILLEGSNRVASTACFAGGTGKSVTIGHPATGMINSYISFTNTRLRGGATTETIVDISSVHLGAITFDGVTFETFHNAIQVSSYNSKLVVENCFFRNTSATNNILNTTGRPSFVTFVDNVYSGRSEDFCSDYSKLNSERLLYRCQSERAIDFCKEYISPDQKDGTRGIIYRKYFDGAISNCTLLNLVGAKLQDFSMKYDDGTNIYINGNISGSVSQNKLTSVISLNTGFDSAYDVSIDYTKQ